MICYKDKTYCTYSDCFKKTMCARYLTDDIRLEADKWWDGWQGRTSVPIAVFTEKPDCYEVRE